MFESVSNVMVPPPLLPSMDRRSLYAGTALINLNDAAIVHLSFVQHGHERLTQAYSLSVLPLKCLPIYL